MRVVSWNMGCSYGPTYKASQRRTWQQLLAWQPDLALVQESLDPSPWLDPDTFVFTPYQWSEGRAVEVGTLVYSATGDLRRAAPTSTEAYLSGQVTLVETTVVGVTEAMLVGSLHADTKALDPALIAEAELGGVGGSHTVKVFPLDLMLHNLRAVTAGRRFLLGGDLNASVRFDDLYPRGSDFYGNVEWFTKAREAGWWNAHRRFHTGDERTLFRPGKPDERFQLDHLFTDRTSWGQLTSCDVLSVPFLHEFTDHAPLVLEMDLSGPASLPDPGGVAAP